MRFWDSPQKEEGSDSIYEWGEKACMFLLALVRCSLKLKKMHSLRQDDKLEVLANLYWTVWILGWNREQCEKKVVPFFGFYHGATKDRGKGSKPDKCSSKLRWQLVRREINSKTFCQLGSELKQIFPHLHKGQSKTWIFWGSEKDD